MQLNTGNTLNPKTVKCQLSVIWLANHEYKVHLDVVLL
jgi:hypothetical protein